jgi:peptidoglycan/LPS O-acetylase OafA/YrhL
MAPTRAWEKRTPLEATEPAASSRPETTQRVWRLPPALREALSRSHAPGLDGLRMVAVLLVVFYHFGFQWVPGGHGVLLFFVLSGFLITWLLLKEQARFGTISLRLFYLRRALRIFPAFFCFWFLWTAALVLSGKRILWGQAISAFFYVSNYYNAILGDPNTGYSHTWSLAIEEQFYLLWPLSLLALWRRPDRAPGILATCIGAVWIHRAVLQFGVGAGQQYFYSAFDTRADHLLVGCLLAVLLHRGRLAWLWERLCTARMSVAVVGLLVTSVWMSEEWGFAYRDVVGFAIDPVLMAVLVVQAMAMRESPLWRWLNWSWVRYLGTISYSIYLYQQIVVDPLKRALAADPLIVQLTFTLGALVLVASSSYYFVERPFLRLKGRIASPTNSRAVVHEHDAAERVLLGPAARGSEVPATVLEAIGRASDAYARGLSAAMAALESLPRLRGEAPRDAVEQWLNLARMSKEGFIAGVSQGFERFERECRLALGASHPPGSGGQAGDGLGRWAGSWMRADEPFAGDGRGDGASAQAEAVRQVLEEGMRAWPSSDAKRPSTDIGGSA